MRGAERSGRATQGACDRTVPHHSIEKSIICATIAYPALENFRQKSMIFISELTKRTYRFKRITSLNISKIYIASGSDV